MTNWEVDVCVEDPRFAAGMETMFEDDLADAREIRLTGPAHRPHIGPVRRESTADQRTRRDAPGHSPRTPAAMARAGVALLRAAGDAVRHASLIDDPARSSERLVTRALGATAVGAGLAAARFPRLLAWPFAALSVGGGALALLHSYRAAPAAQDPDPHDVVQATDGGQSA